MTIQHVKIPMSEVMQLIVDPSTARINPDSTMMLCIDGQTFHVLTGDFEGIDKGTDFAEIIRRNRQ